MHVKDKAIFYYAEINIRFVRECIVSQLRVIDAYYFVLQ